MENSPSGLWRTLGKRVGVTASRVRISYSPPVGLPDDSGSLFSCRKRRLFNGLLRRGATKKLRNSGGVAHIDDFVRSGLPPCITLGTVTVTSGERLPVEIAGKEGGRRWLNPTMS